MHVLILVIGVKITIGVTDVGMGVGEAEGWEVMAVVVGKGGKVGVIVEITVILTKSGKVVVIVDIATKRWKVINAITPLIKCCCCG